MDPLEGLVRGAWSEKSARIQSENIWVAYVDSAAPIRRMDTTVVQINDPYKQNSLMSDFLID